MSKIAHVFDIKDCERYDFDIKKRVFQNQG